MSSNYTIRTMKCEVAAGWIARARGFGIKVTSRPVRFGAEECLAKRDGASIRFTQGLNDAKSMDAGSFTAEQLSIVRDLRQTGLIA